MLNRLSKLVVTLVLAAPLVSASAWAQPAPQPNNPYPSPPPQPPSPPQYPPNYAPQYQPNYAYPPNYYARPVYPPPRYVRPYPPPPPPWVRPYHFIRGYFGFNGFGTIVANQTGGVEYLNSGGGFGIFGGLDIGRYWGIDIGYDASLHNPINDCAGGPYAWCGADFLTLETIHLDAKFHIPTGTRVMPYVQAGGVVSWIGRSNYLTDASGGGFEAGGGVDFWVTRVTTLGVWAMYRGLSMSDYATFTGTGTYLSLVLVGGSVIFHF